MPDASIRVTIVNETGEFAQTEQMPDFMDTAPENIPVNNEPKTMTRTGTKTVPRSGAIIAAGVALNAGRQAAQMVMSNVGMITGDSVKQNRVNTLIKGLGYVAGFASMNPAIMIGTAINLGLEVSQYAINENHRLRWENIRQAEQNKMKNLSAYSEGRTRLI